MLIQATNISKTYSQGKGICSVLKNISLSIYEKEIIAIVGASGSGKTTLLNILGTLDDADEGTIFFQDKPIVEKGKMKLTQKELSKFRNSDIGFVFQFHHLLEDFTAIENIALPMFFKTGNMTQAKEKAKTLLVKLGLEHKENQLPTELSGGEQQRVAIGRALINQPKIIFADEPSGNLDSKNSTMLYDLFLQLSEKENVAIVIVTHNEEYASRAHRTFQMNDGLLTTLT